MDDTKKYWIKSFHWDNALQASHYWASWLADGKEAGGKCSALPFQYQESPCCCLVHLPDAEGKAIRDRKVSHDSSCREDRQQLLQHKQIIPTNATRGKKKSQVLKAAVGKRTPGEKLPLYWGFVPKFWAKHKRCSVSVVASPLWAGETGQQPHTCTSRDWELVEIWAETRHGQKCCSTSSHSHQKAQKRYNLGYTAAQAEESKKQQQARTGPCRMQHG